jgi:hypothetical protein
MAADLALQIVRFRFLKAGTARNILAEISADLAIN